MTSLEIIGGEKPFLSALKGDRVGPPPIWLMRQAGRYLPEYRKVRAEAGSFLDLCYSPHLACEVTLQPIRRFGFDAAILFADILVVPDALGQEVRFVEGEGPRLDAIASAQDLAKLDPNQTADKFSLVFETVERIASALPREVSLIGFCGAPWTVATYMIGGRGSVDQADTRLFAYRHPDLFSELIELLVTVSVDYLSGQVKAGAEVLQIFDSWAGPLPDDQFRSWVIEPQRRMVAELKRLHPEVPIIGFPRGVGPAYLDFVRSTGVDAVSCDTSLPLGFMADTLQKAVPVQGNLDPLLLVCGGTAMQERVYEILRSLSSGPFVFNLGHGILQQTPPENVGALVELVRGSGDHS